MTITELLAASGAVKEVDTNASTLKYLKLIGAVKPIRNSAIRRLVTEVDIQRLPPRLDTGVRTLHDPILGCVVHPPAPQPSRPPSGKDPKKGNVR